MAFWGNVYEEMVKTIKCTLGLNVWKKEKGFFILLKKNYERGH